VEDTKNNTKIRIIHQPSSFFYPIRVQILGKTETPFANETQFRSYIHSHPDHDFEYSSTKARELAQPIVEQETQRK
jgi:hypothetical protein